MSVISGCSRTITQLNEITDCSNLYGSFLIPIVDVINGETMSVSLDLLNNCIFTGGTSVYEIFTGGTVTGPTMFTGGLTACTQPFLTNQINSCSGVLTIPDNTIFGGNISGCSGTLYINQITPCGNNITINGDLLLVGAITAQTFISFTAQTIINVYTGITVTGPAEFTQGLTACTGVWTDNIHACNDVITIHNSIQSNGSLVNPDNYSFALGFQTSATTVASYAIGYQTLASGLLAYAEGYLTQANGFISHAEGNQTIANGDTSHAEGYATQAIGGTSHAEGNQTLALGRHSHAEGNQTLALGRHSHAEGNQTLANGNDSHAEGYLTQANGDISHAEGNQTIASGGTSHAEGTETQAIGVNSHAEGFRTATIGDNSHAEGYQTIASGNSSHAEGYATEAIGDFSHAEGFQTIANGNDSHAEGNQTTAGIRAHAEGDDTIANGDTSHAEGYATEANGLTSHSQGFKTVAFGDFSHSGGYQTRSIGRNSFNHSYSTTLNISGSTGDYSTILGGVDNVVLTNNSGIFSGVRNYISGGTTNLITGGSDNSIIGHDYSGIFAGSGNTIHAPIVGQSFESIIGGFNNTINRSHYSSILGGFNNQMSKITNGSIINSRNVEIIASLDSNEIGVYNSNIIKINQPSNDPYITVLSSQNCDFNNFSYGLISSVNGNNITGSTSIVTLCGSGLYYNNTNSILSINSIGIRLTDVNGINLLNSNNIVISGGSRDITLINCEDVFIPDGYSSINMFNFDGDAIPIPPLQSNTTYLRKLYLNDLSTGTTTTNVLIRDTEGFVKELNISGLTSDFIFTSPEYSNATVKTEESGNMIILSSFEPTNFINYYSFKPRSPVVGEQRCNIYLQFLTPIGFTSWDNSDISFEYWYSGGTESLYELEVFDTTNTSDFNITGTTSTPNTWLVENFDTLDGIYTPGNKFTIRMKIITQSLQEVRLGSIRMRYNKI